MAGEQIERRRPGRGLVQRRQQRAADPLALPVGDDDEAADQAGRAGHPAPDGPDDPPAVHGLEDHPGRHGRTNLAERLDERRDEGVAVSWASVT